MVRKTVWKNIALALLPAFALTITWTFLAPFFSDPAHPLLIWIYHGVFPLFLGFAALIAAKKTGTWPAIGLKWPGRNYPGYMILLAIVLLLIPFLLNLATGITKFNVHPQFNFLLLSLGLPAAIVMALGEELMWRGYLFNQLRKINRLSATSFITGILWALWHFPIIAGTHFLYAGKPIWFSLGMLTIMTISLSFIYTAIRNLSGSIWPCVILHAAENYIAYLILQPAEKSSSAYAAYFTADIGILYIAVLIIAAFSFQKLLRKKVDA